MVRPSTGTISLPIANPLDNIAPPYFFFYMRNVVLLLKITLSNVMLSDTMFCKNEFSMSDLSCIK